MIRGGSGAVAVVLTLCCWESSAAQPEVKVVDIIPQSLGGEDVQQSEPCLAVDPDNPKRMMVTALTSRLVTDPSDLAPVFVTTDGGTSWNVVMALPVSQDQSPSDLWVTHSGSSGHFLAAYLREKGLSPLRVVGLDPVINSGNKATILFNRKSPRDDQPSIVSTRFGSVDTVYVAGNTDLPNGRTAAVSLSTKGGKKLLNPPSVIESRDTYSVDGSDGPPVRVALAPDGSAYAAFLGWRQRVGDAFDGDVVVVHDFPVGKGKFENLKVGNVAGVLVNQQVLQRMVLLPNSGLVDRERAGGDVAIAVDPNNGNTIYLAWLDGDLAAANPTVTIHLYRSLDGGSTWEDVHQDVTSALSFDLAVASNGTVALLYQQFESSNSQWVVHLKQFWNGFASSLDVKLATTSTKPGEIIDGQLPYFGDFSRVLAAGNEFRGVFAAGNRYNTNIRYLREMRKDPNDPDPCPLGEGKSDVSCSIDPFYFSVSVLPPFPPSSTAVASTPGAAPSAGAKVPKNIPASTSFVLDGEVTQIQAASFSGVPGASDTYVLTLKEQPVRPTSVVLTTGNSVTVRRGYKGVKKNGKNVKVPLPQPVLHSSIRVWAEAWIFGEGVAVQELAREDFNPHSSKRIDDVGREVYLAHGARELDTIAIRLNAAQLVFEGAVIAEGPVTKDPSNGEHDPEWRIIKVGVRTLYRGVHQEVVDIRYPSSRDVAWSDVPKPTRDSGPWVFAVSKDAGGHLSVLDRNSAFAGADLERIQPLLERLRQTGTPPPH